MRAKSPHVLQPQDFPSLGSPWGECIRYAMNVVCILLVLDCCIDMLVKFHKFMVIVLRVVHFLIKVVRILFKIVKPYWAGGDILMPGVDVTENALDGGRDRK